MKNLILAHINAELKRRGITQNDIASRLCKSTSTISKWLSKGDVSLKKLDEILAVYEIKVDKIIFK